MDHKEEEIIFDPRLQSPFTMIIAGPTSCGKSQLVFKLIKGVDEMVTPKIHDIYYCYSQWQDGFDEMVKLGVKFNKGLLSEDFLFEDKRDVTKHGLVIIDDLMDPEYVPTIMKLFTVGSHHRSLSVIFITQNLFFNNPAFRTLSLNAHYLVVFKNPRDMSQIGHISKQAFPGQKSFLTEVYNSETKEKHSYILLDFKQSTPNELRVRNSITTPWNTLVFIPKASASKRKR